MVAMTTKKIIFLQRPYQARRKYFFFCLNLCAHVVMIATPKNFSAKAKQVVLKINYYNRQILDFLKNVFKVKMSRCNIKYTMFWQIGINCFKYIKSPEIWLSRKHLLPTTQRTIWHFEQMNLFLQELPECLDLWVVPSVWSSQWFFSL